jgi:hypothetical protein
MTSACRVMIVQCEWMVIEDAVFVKDERFKRVVDDGFFRLDAKI